jgi:hypothetical protein
MLGQAAARMIATGATIGSGSPLVSTAVAMYAAGRDDRHDRRDGGARRPPSRSSPARSRSSSWVSPRSPRDHLRLQALRDVPQDRERHVGGPEGRRRVDGHRRGRAFNAVANAAKVAWGVVNTVTETVWGGHQGVPHRALDCPEDARHRLLQRLQDDHHGRVDAIQAVTSTVTWGAIRTVTVGVWNALKDSADAIWGGIRTAILTPIRAVRDLLGGKDGIWAQMRDAAHDAWEKIKTGAGNFAGI